MKKITLLIAIIFLSITLLAHSATHYVSTTGIDSGTCTQGSPCRTLAYGFSQIVGADTLIIGNGTYTGAANQITRTQSPPSGISTSAMTVIRAETDGQVILDGEGTRNMINFDCTGVSVGCLNKYIKFQGIQSVRGTENALQVGNCNNVGTDVPEGDLSADFDVFYYFKSCGFHSVHDAPVVVWGARNVLFEDTWSWGNGRYGFQVYVADKVVARRHVDRRDDVTGQDYPPTANFVNYTGHDVAFLNCIAIDTTSAYWDAAQDPYSGYYIRETYEYGSPSKYRSSIDTELRGSMTVNFQGVKYPHLSGFFTKDTTVNTIFSNCLTLGSSQGFTGASLDQDVMFDHCSVLQGSTAPDADNYGFGDFSQTNAHLIVANSVVSGNSGLTACYYCISSGDYNNAYGNSSNVMPGAHSTTSNPALLYPLRTESATPNKGTASDGGDKGATIIYKYGTDGTWYGDNGYNTLTSNKLWPWANEALIKTAFLTDYGTASGTRETRGFTAYSGLDGTHNTLTSYVWEYLGNQIPPDVYEDGADTAPPTITGFSIPETATALTISIVTFTATDDVSVTGYCLTEVNSSSGCSWTASAPATYTFYSGGTKTLYAWAQDAALNASAASTGTCVVSVPMYLPWVK